MDHITQSIETLVIQIKQEEAATWKKKTAVNTLRAVLSLPPLYTESVSDSQSVTLTNLRGDEFYGKNLSSVLRTILESRKAVDQGPAMVNEIYDTMVAGGYKFETNDPDNAKRGLRISLTKNSQTFHKLPNGKFGLREWFPNIKEKKQSAPDTTEATEDSSVPKPVINIPEEDLDSTFDMEAKEKEDANARAKTPEAPKTKTKATA
ncbi:MAG TPA: hypothetical protein VG097_16990 [Gemmata sp.]|nr:hypothetical protein [Gemmata sp.]